MAARSYDECIDWSLQYLDNYEEVYNTARTGAEMVSAMTRLYPDVKAEDFAIHWQARLLFPRSSPDWLTPLPGKPGRYFLVRAAPTMGIRRGNSILCSTAQGGRARDSGLCNPGLQSSELVKPCKGGTGVKTCFALTGLMSSS